MWFHRTRVRAKMCVGCPLYHSYPSCCACDYKAPVDEVAAHLELARLSMVTAITKSLFTENIFLKSVLEKEDKHESRWREERIFGRSKGRTIRVPLVYG